MGQELTKEYVLERLQEIIDDDEVKTKDKLAALKMAGDYLKMFGSKIEFDIRALVAQLMLDELPKLLPSKFKYVVILILVIGSLVAGIVSPIYQAFALNTRLDKLEEKGSIQAQLTANDIVWMKSIVNDMGEDLKCIHTILTDMQKEQKDAGARK
jgi:hypothetical protein